MDFTFSHATDDHEFEIALEGVRYEECLVFDKANIEVHEKDGDFVGDYDDHDLFEYHEVDVAGLLEDAVSVEGVNIYDALEKHEKALQVDQEMDHAEAMYG